MTKHEWVARKGLYEILYEQTGNSNEFDRFVPKSMLVASATLKNEMNIDLHMYLTADDVLVN